MSQLIQHISYKIPEASAATGISRSKLYELMKSGELAFVKIGDSTFLEESALRELMTRNRRLNKNTGTSHEV